MLAPDFDSESEECPITPEEEAARVAEAEVVRVLTDPRAAKEFK